MRFNKWLSVATLAVTILALLTTIASGGTPNRPAPSWAYRNRAAEHVVTRPGTPPRTPGEVAKAAGATELYGGHASIAPLPEREAMAAEVLRPVSAKKVRVVVDLESTQKAVWVRHGDSRIAIPIEVLPPAGDLAAVPRAKIGGAGYVAYGQEAGWAIPSSIVVDTASNRVGIRHGSDVEYLTDAVLPPHLAPVTEHILSTNRNVAKR